MKTVRDAIQKAHLTGAQFSMRDLARQARLDAPISLKTLIEATIPPEEKVFTGQVLTPPGTALGGDVSLTLRSNGTFHAHFHMHDSGAPDYDFMVHAIVLASNGLTFVVPHGGHVEGTASGLTPRRDDVHDENGSSPFIRDHWPAIKEGKLHITKDYAPTGVIGFVQDLAKAVIDLGANIAGDALGVVVVLGEGAGKLVGNFGLGGAFGLIAGVVVFAAGGCVVMAITEGAVVGAMTNALIKQRPITRVEAANVAVVFGGSLPPPDKLWVTNLLGLGNRAFTMPGPDGKIYLNIGPAFDYPTMYKGKDAYRTAGQLFIHELTHAWQIFHSSFIPGTVCNGLANQAKDQLGEDVYNYYGPATAPWGSFNLEQQATIVDKWFARIAPETKLPMYEHDPYFIYIQENIRKGRL